jgi:hypothetical protein
MAKKHLIARVELMNEYYACKKEFARTHNHKPCRIAHRHIAVCRLYRQWNQNAGCHPGTHRIPHRRITYGNPGPRLNSGSGRNLCTRINRPETDHQDQRFHHRSSDRTESS